MATIQVTDASFDQDVLKAVEPVAVYFWAPWCGPCRAIAPALEEISGELAGTIKITKVNLDENHGIASKYGVRSLPSILIFKGGEVIGQRAGGGFSKGDMVKWFQSV